MALQLTPEQEARIRTVVAAGAYRSAEEAIDAAVAAVEFAAAPGFDGTIEELDELLLDGLNSGVVVETGDAYWDRLQSKTDALATEHLARTKLR